MSRKKAAILIVLLLIIAGLVRLEPWSEPIINPGFIDNFVKNMEENHASQGLVESLVDRLAYDHRNMRLAVGRESGDIEIWDLKYEYSKQIIKEAHEQRADHLYFSVDGKRLFSGSSLAGDVKLWDAQTGKPLSAFTLSPGFSGPMLSAAKGDYYLIAASSAVQIYDGRQNTLDPRVYETSGLVQALAVEAKTGLVAVGTASGSIDLFQFSVADEGPNLEKVKEIKPYETGNWVIALSFSPDGQSLYTVPGRPGQVDEWSVPDLKKVRTKSTSGNFVSAARFSPDKRLLAVVGNARKGGQGGDYAIELIALASGRSIIQPVTTNFGQVVFIPQLKQLLAVHGYTVTPIDIPEDF